MLQFSLTNDIGFPTLNSRMYCLKGGMSSFLFILLIKLDSVVFLLRYYFIKVLKFLKPFMIKLKL